MGTSYREFRQMRPVSDEAMDAARAATEEKIRAYELREARKACGLTQEQVSERMGVGQKRVSAVETGKIDTLKVDTLRRYVAALGGDALHHGGAPAGGSAPFALTEWC